MSFGSDSACHEPVCSKYFAADISQCRREQHRSSRQKRLRTDCGSVGLCGAVACESAFKEEECNDMRNSKPFTDSMKLHLVSNAPYISVPHCFKEEFFNVPCETLAQALLGKILVRRLDNGTVLKGRIVETECYLGEEDKASHSFGGRRTERNSPMFMKPGTSYVYLTYGMYHCFNISSQGAGAAVLIRALEPLEGLEVMAALRLRGVKRPLKKDALRPEELCSGPSKLCVAMAIDRETCNKQDLCSWPGLTVLGEQDDKVQHQVVVTKRIGIESAGAEWANKPLRFYLRGNRFVSKRDKKLEKEMSG